MMRCWERRGCDEEWMSRCPHNLGNDVCPTECFNVDCFLPTHVVATDFALLLNPDLEYSAAVKECCRWCEHFLTHGPRKGEGAGDPTAMRESMRFLI
ncbi:hypothetical protein HLV37_07005 [Eggerthellaceae bacterium zg-1084]|uniref:Uncharacterized protein n=1 Tax=Berryella wangjianweii TaxID=2734634 RepID=A0A6M8J3R2_9ACTN|nr:hypothetical protein [Berryella wangjianweii]NPD31597.1 hypothetical protein [Berryella wangjianweii]NPD32908.1 hypothetical protein [Eggerthellaceae bacterium zg-997]QKF07781.1 hypothetical protein HLV38_06415 [Berryella wangjianweii]